MQINYRFIFSTSFLLFLAIISGNLTAQVNNGHSDSLSADQLLDNELQRIEELTLRSPHYKNPRAAGRIKTLNRSVPTFSDTLQKVQLFGPAYKMRKRMSTSTDSLATSPSSNRKPKLMGPRYKNRRAKAHQDSSL